MRRSLVAGLLAVAACSGGGDDASPTTLPGDGIDVPASEGLDVELVDFDDAPVRLADYAGRPLVVNFFASWCVPCVQEMPAIERVKEDVGDQVAFLGVATNDRVEDALDLVEQTGVTWDLARDPQGEAAVELGVVRMPTTFLIDAGGEVVETHGGDISEDELRDLLAERFGIDP